MAGKDLLLEAKNLLNTISTRIDTRVLGQSEKLKTEVISLASRIKDLSDKLAYILDSLVEKIGDRVKESGIVGLDKYLYIVFEKNKFVIVRTRPFYITLLYDKDEGKLRIRSRNLLVDLETTSLTAAYMAMKVSIKIDSVDDYKNMYNELRYIMKRFGRIVDQYIVPVMEARIKAIE